MQKENIKMILLVLGILVGLVLLVSMRTTTTKTRHLNPGGGDVSIQTEYVGSQIAVDGLVEHATKKEREVYKIFKLDDGDHQVAVNIPGYYPWAKNVTSTSDTHLIFKSFSILQNPKRENVTNYSDDYKKYRVQFDSLIIPSEQNKRISNDKTVAIWAELNSIFAEWLGEPSNAPSAFCSEGICKARIKVVSSLYNIRSLAFLNERNDVVLFSDDQGVYAIEIDTHNIQNFQPLYKTAIAQFIPDTARSIIIESRGDIFKLSF